MTSTHSRKIDNIDKSYVSNFLSIRIFTGLFDDTKCPASSKSA